MGSLSAASSGRRAVDMVDQTRSAPFSVLAVDDETPIRELLEVLIDLDDRLVLAGTACDGAAAVRQAQSSCPDVIILDVKMPVMTGLEALPLLRRSCPAGIIVMYTSDAGAAVEATRGGADAIYDKAEDPAVLLDAVVALCEGWCRRDRTQEYEGSILRSGSPQDPP